MGVREVGNEVINWINDKIETLTGKLGSHEVSATVENKGIITQIREAVKNAFANLSTEERLLFDAEFNTPVSPIDFREYFSTRETKSNDYIKDSGGMIFDYLMNHLEDAEKEHILELLPNAQESNIQRLSPEQALRMLSILQNKFGKIELAVTADGKPDDTMLNLVAIRQQLTRKTRSLA